MTIRAQASADTVAIAPEIGIPLTIKRQGVFFRSVIGYYAPRPEIATDYTMERTIQRASITFFHPTDIVGLDISIDTVVIPDVGERKFFGQPKTNAFGWSIWEIVGL